VTGTPIQNRLDDLLSLLKFLHFEPFCRPSVFQRYILDPLSKENSERVKMLHVLLRGICLRRNESYLELSEPCHKEIKLTLSTEERALYDGVLRKFQDDLDNLVSTQSKTKKYAILFAIVIKLRQLCNHGTMFMTDQLLPAAVLDLDSGSFCDYCQGNQDDNLATLNKDQVCPECNRIISISFQRGGQAPSTVSPTSISNSPVSVEFMVDQTPLRTQFSQGSLGRQISTKLAAVVENLKMEAQDSKR
jgi:SNF2 family DNA or RNA helicase